jgi:hypothetical protein
MCEEDGGGVVVGIMRRRWKNEAHSGVVTYGCSQEIEWWDEDKDEGRAGRTRERWSIYTRKTWQGIERAI